MSKDYEKWLDRYLKNGCTDAQLKRLVELKQITESELEKMLGIKAETALE